MKKKRHLKQNVVRIISVVLFVFGIFLLSYPTASNKINESHQSRVIAGYQEAMALVDDREVDKELELARKFNDHLKEIEDLRYGLYYEPDLSWYNELMNGNEYGIIGYIEIPGYVGKQPIYHGTSNEVLQTAIGHLEGSSFTTGVKGEHAVYVGHNGLPSARLFTDTTKMKVGDKFIVYEYNRKFVYEVDLIEKVLPDEVDLLAIDENEDYATLLTCVPYGVNSHRLLLRGHRIEVPEEEIEMIEASTETEPKGISEDTLYMIGGAGLLILLLVFLYWSFHGEKKKKK